MAHQKLLHIDDKSYRNKAIGTLVVCILFQAIPFCIGSNIQPLFIPYVLDKYHFNLAAFSAIFTWGSVTSAIASPVIGKLYTKVKVKVMFTVGICMAGLGFMGFSISHNLFMFYLMAIIAQIGLCIFSSIGLPFVIHHWFPASDAGKALGLTFAGSSMGNIVMQTLTMQMIERKGIDFSYLTFGLISLIVGLILALFFIRLPKNKPVAGTQPAAAPTVSAIAAGTGPDIKAVQRIPAFWMFRIGYTIVGISIAALSTQYAEYFRHGLDLDATMIGTIGSTFAIASLIGNIGGGGLFDKIGSFKSMAIAGILMVIATLSLMLAPKMHWMSFIFAVAYGLNVYSYMSGPAYLSSAVFGSKDYSQKLGAVNLFFALGFATGSVIFGLIVGKSDRFSIAWLVVLLAIIVGYALLLYSIKTMKKHSQTATTATTH